MVIYFLHILLAYNKIISRVWQVHKRFFLILGLPFAISLLVALIYINEYEGLLTDYLIDKLAFLFSSEIRKVESFEYSFLFFIEMFSVRTCFLIFILYFVMILGLVLLFPLFYIICIYLSKSLVDKDISFSWKQLNQLFLHTIRFFFYRSPLVILYLFICMLFSFIPIVNIFIVLTALLVTAYFMGLYLLGLVKKFRKLPKLQYLEKEFQMSALLAGSMVMLSFLVPLLGWIFIPIIHIPAMMIYLEDFGKIE